MSGAYCSECGSRWPSPHLTTCSHYVGPKIKKEYSSSGRQSGKTAAAFDIALDRLELGETVYGIRLSDE